MNLPTCSSAPSRQTRWLTERRFPGFDEKIVSMYARGKTVREIQNHPLDLYGPEVSPDLVSTITDAVLETVAEWQNRPLEAM